MSGEWKIIKGQNPILLVASHNYPQIREAIIKPRDIGTGNLVERLCETTSSWGTISETVQLDPNWYKNSDFRNMVKNIIKRNNIKVVLDIHGRRKSWPRIIDFYPNNSFKQKFSSTLDGLSVIDFKDGDQTTLSEDIDRLNVPSIEIEIRRDGREIGTKNYYEVISVLERVIRNLMKFPNGV